MYQGDWAVHPPAVGDVPRVGGPPAGHVQLLLQLPGLRHRLSAVQENFDETLWSQAELEE